MGEYKLIFDEKAIESIEKLPSNIQKRIVNKLKESKLNPHHYFEKLTNRDEFKLRVGEYRIIAEINNNEITILILYVDHRKRVYKKL
jgi:mRNA interferase RelE/StbE